MTDTTTTTDGTRRSVADGAAVAFRGIPYARPPPGPLRFALPQRPSAPGRQAARIRCVFASRDPLATLGERPGLPPDPEVEMPLAPLDLLAVVEAVRVALLGCLRALTVDDRR